MKQQIGASWGWGRGLRRGEDEMQIVFGWGRPTHIISLSYSELALPCSSLYDDDRVSPFLVLFTPLLQRRNQNA